MRRTNRLFDITNILRDGKLHRAQDLAAQLGVSLRTIYRDMDTLCASGFAIEGERGAGYRLLEAVTLPPLTLTPEEFEALNLGLAIVLESADPILRIAAERLAAKVDDALPTEGVPEADAWKFAVYPFGDAARGASHLPTLRASIQSRQKLQLRYREPNGAVTEGIVRPLHMETWGRFRTLTAWCELRDTFHVFRVDLIEDVSALPELFVDEPGKQLSDFSL
jgi:predicted DNA-binding transcriptional regulator YafY